MMQRIDIVLLIIYFVVVLIIGVLSSRKETEEGFLIADRNLGTLHTNATITASLVGGGTLIAYIALVYLFGFSALWLFLGISLGTIIFIPFAVKLKQEGDKQKHYTMLDFLFIKFGRKNNIIAAFFLFFMFLCLISVGLIIGAEILSSITGFSYSASILISVAAVLFYLLLGGFKAVVKTDLFQYLFIFLFVVVAWFFLTNIFTKNLVEYSQLNLFSISIEQIIGFIIMGIFIIFVSADVWQRAYAAKNIKTVKKGFVFAAVSTFLIGLFSTFLGLIARKFSNIDPNEALLYSFNSLLPPTILGVVLVALFSAVISTVDTGIFVSALFFSRDLISKYKKITKKELVSLTRKTIFILTLIAAFIAILIKDMVFIMYSMFNFSLVLAPAVIGSFFFNLKKKAISLSLIIGIITAIIITVLKQITPEMTILPFILSGISLVISQKIFKKE